MKSKLARRAIAIAAACTFSTGQVLANGTVDFKIDLSGYGFVRTISDQDIGAGFDFFNAYLTSIFSTDLAYTEDANKQAIWRDTTNSYQAIKNLNFGTYRFPMGTAAEYYIWNAPCRSYRPDGTTLPTSQYLKPEDLFENFVARTTTSSHNRAALSDKNEILWQVNTYRSVDGDNAADCSKTDKVNWREAVMTVNNVQQLNDGSPGAYAGSGLDYVAKSAGLLVANNRQRVPAHQVTYWEIGNEDWSRLTPEQYAKIFVKVALEMKLAKQNTPAATDATHPDPAGKPLRLFAQATTTNSWISKFAAEVKRLGDLSENQAPAQNGQLVRVSLNDVYGLSLHSYTSGNMDPSIDMRTKLMYANNDWSSDINSADAAISAVTGTTSYGITSRWKLWVTEYSACESCGNNDMSLPSQTLNQGLAIVDKTARMFWTGVVDRVIIHSLDQHPKFTLVSWDPNNNGGTFDIPRKMASGLVMEKFNSLFKGSMYSTDWGTGSNGYQANYVAIPGKVTSAYLGTTSYAVVDPTNTKLNVMLVNRDLTSSTTVNLAPTGGRLFDTTKKFTTSTMSGAMGLNNSGQPGSPLPIGFVDSAPQTTGSTVQVSLPAGGLMFVTIPLKP
ncbi:MAG: hypothetical protein QM749_01345 [Aquabacterium sp.]